MFLKEFIDVCCHVVQHGSNAEFIMLLPRLQMKHSPDAYHEMRYSHEIFLY